MQHTARRLRHRALVVCAVGLLWTLTSASEAPDLELNSVTGHVESVDIDDNGLVRHVEDTGQGGSRTATTISGAAGKAPRIAINATGDSCVVWWLDGTTDEVYYTVKDLVTGDWATEKLISESSEDSRRPEVVYDGLTAWVAFEIDTGTDIDIAVLGIIDSAEPFPTRTIVDTTDFGGNVDVMIHAELGNVWVTWVDGAADVGWSEYDAVTGLWGVPQFESYAASDVQTARELIRDAVLGP